MSYMYPCSQLTLVFDKIYVSNSASSIIDFVQVPELKAVFAIQIIVRLTARPESTNCLRIDQLSSFRASYPSIGTLDSNIVCANPSRSQVAKCSDKKVVLALGSDRGEMALTTAEDLHGGSTQCIVESEGWRCDELVVVIIACEVGRCCICRVSVLRDNKRKSCKQKQ